MKDEILYPHVYLYSHHSSFFYFYTFLPVLSWSVCIIKDDIKLLLQPPHFIFHSMHDMLLHPASNSCKTLYPQILTYIIFIIILSTWIVMHMHIRFTILEHHNRSTAHTEEHRATSTYVELNSAHKWKTASLIYYQQTVGR